AIRSVNSRNADGGQTADPRRRRGLVLGLSDPDGRRLLRAAVRGQGPARRVVAVPPGVRDPDAAGPQGGLAPLSRGPRAPQAPTRGLARVRITLHAEKERSDLLAEAIRRLHRDHVSRPWKNDELR